MAKGNTNIRVFKGAGCPDLDKKTLELMVKFLKLCISELELGDHEIKIRLLSKAPKEPITTGAYSPANKTCSTIIEGRTLVDWCRTIAHELTHYKQDLDGKLNQPHPEIGGDIEDEANIMSGRIVKYYIKKVLTKEEKEFLGVGSYGT